MEDLPDLMTAAVTTGHGGPDMVEIHRDWPRPRPGAREALIRVTAAGVNNTDLWAREGSYGTADDAGAVAGWQGVPLEFPLIQGGDVTGVVADVAVGVDRELIGRRVLVDPAAEYDQHGHPSRIVGSEVDGGFAQFHVSAVDRLHDMSTSPLSDQQLASLPVAYATALGMIEAAACQPGERVLVTGASGGVGLAATQMLASRGCLVVAYTSEGKARSMGDSGASEIVTRGKARLSDVEEFDAVLDVVGGDEFAEFVGRLRTGGRLATVGAIAGPMVQLDLRRLYLRHRRLIGSTMHSPRIFHGVAELARRGAVSPVVADAYPLTEIVTAQERFMSKDFVGKLVVIPPPLGA
ncbi:MAG TPA: zinc-binding dehydrogenase [Acidimicrobiia bacterium]|nr:zinc-binding dehydrogenase [Acidimicrobiia bacterium]